MTVLLVPETLTLLLVEAQVAVYEVGVAPVLALVNATDICAAPAVSELSVGVPGMVVVEAEGVTDDDVEALPVPVLLVALTLQA